MSDETTDGYVRTEDDEYWELNEADRYVRIPRALWPDTVRNLPFSEAVKQQIYMCFERENDGLWLKIPRSTWILLHHR